MKQLFKKRTFSKKVGPFKKAESKTESIIEGDRTRFDKSPTRSVNFDEETRSTAKIAILSGDIFYLPGNLLFGCLSNYGS